MKQSVYGIVLMAGMMCGAAFGAEGPLPVKSAQSPAGQEVVSVSQALEVVLKEADNGRRVSLKAGQQFQIRLKGNATTGYTWHFLVPAKGVAIVKEEYATRKNGMVGAPGETIVTLKATCAGRYPVAGFYYRTWEGLKPASDQAFVITADIAK